MRRFLETAVALVTALLLVGTWLVEPYSVVSGSMHPTLLGPHREFVCPACGHRNLRTADAEPVPGRPAYCAACQAAGPIEDRLPVLPGDGLLVDRTAFWFRTPRRGEVIAFRLPHQGSHIAVKRVVGLPGEMVELRDGQLTAGGVTIPARPDADFSPPPWHHGPRRWVLGPDEYFVVGDNPPVSDDSRTWPTGPGVASQLLVGKPIAVHAPRRVTSWFGLRFHVPDLSAIRYIR